MFWQFLEIAMSKHETHRTLKFKKMLNIIQDMECDVVNNCGIIKK